MFAKQEASAYFDGRARLWSVVKDSYVRLSRQFDVMVIGGRAVQLESISENGIS
jgi:adenosylcobyric acid synthase